MSKVTKKYQRLSTLFFVLSMICLIAPIIVYTVMGFIAGTVGAKFTLGIALMIAILLVLINIIFKFHIRSTIWILVLGIYFCIENILPLLLVVAIGTILDEFIFTPLHKSFRNKAKINKEIDKRIE